MSNKYKQDYLKKTKNYILNFDFEDRFHHLILAFILYNKSIVCALQKNTFKSKDFDPFDVVNLNLKKKILTIKITFPFGFSDKMYRSIK